jgi:hypothetical protein
LLLLLHGTRKHSSACWVSTFALAGWAFVKGKKSIYLLQRTVAFIVRHVSGLEGGWKGWRRTFEAVTVR